MQKRACFDFEVAFSNGGGIQGQGFRLDIEGSDIDDDALAAYIIRDMRLLMVKHVHILNKQIIEEAHKRAAPAHTIAPAPDHAPTYFDLSHSIESGMVTCRELPAPLVRDHLSRHDSPEPYAEGTTFQIGRTDKVANTGTHIDTPCQRSADGRDLAGLDLARVSNVPGVLVRVAGALEQAIDWHAFAAVQCGGRAVLIQTGWDHHWGTQRYLEGHPFLTEKAALHLRDQGALLVGIDSPDIDDTRTGTQPVRSVLLGAGIPIIEHMAHLDALPLQGFHLHATPPRIVGMRRFPVRAHATLDPGSRALPR